MYSANFIQSGKDCNCNYFQTLDLGQDVREVKQAPQVGNVGNTKGQRRPIRMEECRTDPIFQSKIRMIKVELKTSKEVAIQLTTIMLHNKYDMDIALL